MQAAGILKFVEQPVVEALVDAVGDLAAPVEGVEGVGIVGALGQKLGDVGKADQSGAAHELGIDALEFPDEVVQALRAFQDLPQCSGVERVQQNLARRLDVRRQLDPAIGFFGGETDVVVFRATAELLFDEILHLIAPGLSGFECAECVESGLEIVVGLR